jgi:hypothetical protein
MKIGKARETNEADSVDAAITLLSAVAHRGRRAIDQRRYTAMPHSFLAVLAVTVLLMSGRDSGAQTPPALTATQTNLLVFYDSKSNRFANVNAILPASIMREPMQGKWRGELSPNYVRPPTNYILASDKLTATNWHSLICYRENKKPSTIMIMLHPNQADDYVLLNVSALSGTVTGRWFYGTDGGVVDSGAVVVSPHK